MPSRVPTDSSLPTNVVKKLEKDLLNEAKSDEKAFKHAAKELQGVEKAEAKIRKVPHFPPLHTC
jgi:hypothetical protein